MKGLKKSTYWMGVGILLILFFTLTGTPLIQTCYFVSFLMPVIVATSYYFNHHLIPHYLSTGLYKHFSIYTIYTVIFALFAQAIILFLSLLLFSNFQTDQLNHLGIDLFSLGLGTLLVILINAFYQSVITLNHQKKTIDDMKNELRLTEIKSITVKANRRNYHIPFTELMVIESKGDYVQLYLDTESITTKEKISKIGANLPSQFIRTHRSFIVNQDKIQSYNKSTIIIAEHEIPISRTYKKAVLQILNSQILDR